MKYIIFALLITTAFICSTRGDVFEASSSEDASMFIRDDPHKNRAILFYDEVQEVSQKDVHKRDDKIISIFLKKGEKDRLKEDWVDKLKDEVNLMIVDAFKQENADIVRKFNVKATPYIIMFENHKTQFESIVDDKTFDKVKELLLKSEEDKTLRPTFSNDFVPPRVDEAKPKTTSDSSKEDTKKASETKIPHYPQYQPPQTSSSQKNDDKSKSSDKPKSTSVDNSKTTTKPKASEKKGSGNPNESNKQKDSDASKKPEEEQAVEEALKELDKAKKMDEDAEKEVKKATDALDKAKKEMVEYAKVEDAQKNANKAKEETDKALKKYQEAKKKLDDKISSIKKEVGSSSPSNTPSPISSVPVNYPVYNSPTPYLSQMLNPNYSSQYMPYQGAPRRMF